MRGRFLDQHSSAFGERGGAACSLQEEGCLFGCAGRVERQEGFRLALISHLFADSAIDSALAFSPVDAWRWAAQSARS